MPEPTSFYEDTNLFLTSVRQFQWPGCWSGRLPASLGAGQQADTDGNFRPACGLLPRRAGALAVTVAYWQFNPANLGADASGNGNTLIVNNITSSTDVPANAPGTNSAVFDGSTSYAETSSTLNLSQYGALTVECFVKTNGQSSLGMVYEDTANNNANLGGFYFDFNETAGDVKVSQSENKLGTYSTQLTPYPKNGNWHHYALTIDETGPHVVFQIYIDGVLATNTTGSLSNGSVQFFPDAPFYVGCRGAASFFFKGEVDDLRISSRVLPPSGFLTAPAYTNASILVTQQPTNTTVEQSRGAVFRVAATLQNGDQRLLEFQWQTNGVPLPGATASICALPPALLSYQGMDVSVVVSVPSVGGVTPVTSSNAVLSVTPDTTPPGAASAYAAMNTMIGVLFNELLDANSAQNAANYALDGGASVLSAALQPDGQTLLLEVSTLTNATYTLSYTGIGDLAGNYATNTTVVTNAGYTSMDFGTVTTPSIVISTNAASFTVIGGDGGDIFGTADGCNYDYTSVSGDFDVRLQIYNVNDYDNSTSTRGGLMVREDTTPGSRNILIGAYATAPNNDWVCTIRGVAGGSTIIDKGSLVARGSGFSFPNAWVRLTRAGQTFTSYYSTNDIDWTQYSTNITFSSSFASNALIGMASDSVSTSLTAAFQYSLLNEFALGNGSIAIVSQPNQYDGAGLHSRHVFGGGGVATHQFPKFARLSMVNKWNGSAGSQRHEYYVQRDQCSSLRLRHSSALSGVRSGHRSGGQQQRGSDSHAGYKPAVGSLRLFRRRYDGRSGL